MGCASSKQGRCKHCKAPYDSLPRSYSVPVHHPATGKGDTYHVVALTSSTLGSLPADSIHRIDPGADPDEVEGRIAVTDSNIEYVNDNNSVEFLTEVLQAKNWSTMIEEKIPKVIPRTPIRTPPGEPETINTWEMMEGLDDYSPLRFSNQIDRSFSFHGVSTTSRMDQLLLRENDIDSPTMGHSVSAVPSATSIDQPKSLENGNDSLAISHLKQKPEEDGVESPKDDGAESPKENGAQSPKPQWQQMADDDSISNLSSVVTDFDPEIVSQFRKALEKLSPVATVYLKSPEHEKIPFSRDGLFLSDDFIDTKVVDIITPTKRPPGGDDRVVIYFTSLRALRKTYEDSCHVRIIFKRFGVRVDERDVSMHYGFREELRELSAETGCGGGLPRVFVKGWYIGGAEEITQLNEDGMLEKLVEGCEMVDGDDFGPCEVCGDVRFVPCESCSGSCKIYCEDGDEEWEGENVVGDFQRCPDCNENGLVRCPVCCY